MITVKHKVNGLTLTHVGFHVRSDDSGLGFNFKDIRGDIYQMSVERASELTDIDQRIGTVAKFMEVYHNV